MIVWRLSLQAFADVFDGGYGFNYDGRWNTRGHAVTSCASSPALCVLEKLVHIEDPSLMPDLALIAYDIPDELRVEDITLEDSPDGWAMAEGLTQEIGDRWHETGTSPLLRVPSAIVPVGGSPDANLVINNGHAAAARITAVRQERFALDRRLI